MVHSISAATEAGILQSWPDILAAIAAGELVKNVLAANGVTRESLRIFLVRDAVRRTEWEQAREASADAFMDLALDEAMANKTQFEAAHSRTRIDTLKWAARIRNPRLYGDKAQLDVNVRTVDLTRIISEANARLANAPRARVLEHNQAPGALLPALVAPRTVLDLM